MSIFTNLIASLLLALTHFSLTFANPIQNTTETSNTVVAPATVPSPNIVPGSYYPGTYCDEPGRYACNDDQSMILVCTPSHVWIVNSNCGRPDHCQYLYGPPTPYCT